MKKLKGRTICGLGFRSQPASYVILAKCWDSSETFLIYKTDKVNLVVLL